MTVLHILCTDETPRPWWPADQRWDIPGDKSIWCDCCNAYSPASETDVRLMAQELPIGCLGDYQHDWLPYGPSRPMDVGFQISYFDAYWRTKCADGFGCTIKPRRRASAHLRERL